MRIAFQRLAAMRVKGARSAAHAAALLVAWAALADGGVARGAVKSWSAASGPWGAGGNWSPAGVPGVADDVLIGPHINAANEVVTLSANTTVDSITITDGMTLRTSNSRLEVAGGTQLSGQNIVGPSTFASRLRVENGVAGVDFETNNLSLSNHALVTLEGNASALVGNAVVLGSDAELRGHGSVYIEGDGPPALVNDGRIEATAGGLTIYQSGSGRLDLDGAGGGLLVADTGNGTGLAFFGDQLADAFDGDIELGANSSLGMNFANGWSGSSASSLLVTGGGNVAASVLEGDPFSWAGDIEVTGNLGRLRIDADVELLGAAVVNVDVEDQLEFHGATIVSGGDYNLASGAELRFLNDVTIAGGSFSTSGASANSGRVSFLGPSHWQGDVTLSGRSRVNGMAFVEEPTTIDADQFDMDGSGGNTIWEIDAALIVNAEQIDETNNSFDGVVYVGGDAFSRLRVNLADPAEPWRMMGTMNLDGISALYYTRVAGSRMEVGGDLNIEDANINISAEVTLMDGGEVNFAAAGSDLRLSAPSRIEAGATFTGQGTLHNNANGAGMVIAGGTSLGQARLVNSGRLAIGDGAPGEVAVDRFVNESGDSLQVFVGGETAGSELSHLSVTGGTAQLAGTLLPTLWDDGGGLFAPQLGDEFTILTAAGGIVGEFDALVQPAGMPTGLLFEVDYTPTSVVLYVDNTYEADFDRDGDVDGADLNVWQSAYGASNGGDANHDGISDGSDFLVWQRQFGSGVPMSMAAAVPEPTAAMLLGAVAVASCCGRRRRLSSLRR